MLVLCSGKITQLNSAAKRTDAPLKSSVSSSRKRKLVPLSDSQPPSVILLLSLLCLIQKNLATSRPSFSLRLWLICWIHFTFLFICICLGFMGTRRKNNPWTCDRVTQYIPNKLHKCIENNLFHSFPYLGASVISSVAQSSELQPYIVQEYNIGSKDLRVWWVELIQLHKMSFQKATFLTIKYIVTLCHSVSKY